MAETVKDILRRPGCKLLVFHSGETLKVPNALFRLFPVKSGETFEHSAWQARITPIENGQALETAARHLEARDRSTDEIFKKLVYAGYSERAAAYACGYLTEAGYLDDARFAGQSLQRLGRKYGALRIRQELRQKGIAKPLIEELLENQDEEESLDAAVALARKSARGKSADPAAAYRKAYAMLARRGFPPPLVKKALSLVFRDEGD